MKKTALVLILLSIFAFSAAHTGDNHSQEQLEQAEHERTSDFAFVSGDYPVQTREIVIAEILFVTLLLALSLNHYRKKSSAED